MPYIHIPVALEQARSARMFSWGSRFFLTAALTACQTPGGYAPFALGLIAAAGPAAPGGAALAGAAAGAILFMNFTQALPFLAVAILIVTAATALRGPWITEHPKAVPAGAVGLFMTVELLYVIQSLSPLTRLGNCLGAAGLLGAAAWLFRPVMQSGTGCPANGLVYMGSVLLLAAADLEIAGLSPCRGALCLLLAWASYGRGSAGGAALGLGLGLTADLCGGDGAYTAAFGLAGLLCGSCRGRWRWCAALAFLGGVAAASLPGRDVRLLVETAAGMAVFLLLPNRAFGGKRVRGPEEEKERQEAAAGQRWKEQLSRAAGALRDLYDTMGRNTPQTADENPAVVFDRAAEKVCRSCALCELCWQREYGGTFNALNDATPYLLERGRALAKDFPSYFTSRCIHLPELLAAIDTELSAFLLRRQYRRQLEETRRSARGQYAQLSELLTATAAGLGTAVPAGAAQTPCRIGAVLRPKEGESVCGDTVMSFQTEQGTWCLLLADGMGSGEAARKESALTCRLLGQFLEAGIAPDAALKTLNSAMALRGAETGSFTTIDLCVFDPGTGEAVFYKFGAAPSYLKRNGIVRRITGGSLPAGLRGTAAAPDVTKAQLEPGSFAVMISDGVADPNEDEWLQDLLAGWSGDDPQTLAGLILTESIRREQMRDDCAVQILHRPGGSVRV